MPLEEILAASTSPATDELDRASLRRAEPVGAPAGSDPAEPRATMCAPPFRRACSGAR